MIKILDFNGADKGSYSLPDALASREVNKHVIWELITAENANMRQGTHKVKLRSEVSGGGRKPWRQKGTGHARSGSNRSPVWVGGGTVFGPLPRTYNQAITKKKKIAGYRNIILDKIQRNGLVVLDELLLKEVKTSVAFSGIKKVVAASPFYEAYSERRKLRENSHENRRKITLVVKEESAKKAFRNIPWIQWVNVERVSARMLYYNHGLIVTKDAMEQMVSRFIGEK